MKQTLIRDNDSTKLDEVIKNYSSKNIVLITGKNSFVNSGAKEYIEKALNLNEVTIFSDFNVNPKLEDVKKGINAIKDIDCQLIVAIGGGSVIDMAKLISGLHNQPQQDLEDIISGLIKVEVDAIPILAIPTTSGTGSEATHFAVVYINKVKYSFAAQQLLPHRVVLNSDLVMSQSPYLMGCTGLDALSQAIESYWSVNSTIESKRYAKKAIELLNNNLEKAVNEKSMEYCEKVAFASYLAGKAINISKTTAAHALSYAFTTYHNIPHGHAVFLTLPKFISYNFDLKDKSINDKRGASFVKETMRNLINIFGLNNALEVELRLEEIARNIGLELDLKKNGVTNNDISFLLNNVNEERLKNNPTKVCLKEVERLLTI